MQPFRLHLVLWPVICVGSFCVMGAEPAKPTTPSPALDLPLLYDGKTFDEWQEILRRDRKPTVRAEAINALTTLGREERGGEVAAIIIALGGQFHSQDYIWDQEELPIRQALSRIGKMGRPAVSPLLDALRSENPGIRKFALSVLDGRDELPPHLDTALRGERPRLLRMAHSGNMGEVADALNILVRTDNHDPDNPITICGAVVLELLGSRNPQVRLAALGVLPPQRGDYYLGDVKERPVLLIEAKTIVPVLTRLLSDENPTVRQKAFLALERHGEKANEAIPVLCKLIESCKIDPEIEASVYSFLGHRGAAAKEALPILKQRLSSGQVKDESSRKELARALEDLEAALKRP